jgi:hypothetical protein
MFRFYQNAIEWYLHSKFGRFVRSFNENLTHIFEEAKQDIDDSINELYRETAIVNTAMVAMINGKVSQLEAELRRQRHNYEVKDTLAGRRMESMMQATWTETKRLQALIETAGNLTMLHTINTPGHLQKVATIREGHSKAQVLEHNLEPFICGDEGPSLFERGRLVLANEDVHFKLRAWMVENQSSRSLWISSPYESKATTTGSLAAALATMAAAWQAETPMISHFCKRPYINQLRSGLSIEQVGLISLVYSLIRQLLQFDRLETGLDLEEIQVDAFDGNIDSWDTSLKALRALLNHSEAPQLLFCVIEGLNELEWGSGSSWCAQLLDVLMEKQRRAGTIFNVLFTTAGQSQVLPQFVEFGNRHMTTKRAREIQRTGREVLISTIHQTCRYR